MPGDGIGAASVTLNISSGTEIFNSCTWCGTPVNCNGSYVASGIILPNIGISKIVSCYFKGAYSGGATLDMFGTSTCTRSAVGAAWSCSFGGIY